MGNTTVIELNHDWTGEIERDPEAFVRAILEQLRSFEHSGERIPGGHVICGFHRGDTQDDVMWEEYKMTRHDWFERECKLADAWRRKRRL